MTKTLPELVAAVRAYALENYEHDGWDFVVECYSDKDLAELISSKSAKTPTLAIAAVRPLARILNERRADVEAEIF
ncbi:MAG: hypothetical protein ACO24H_10775 [Polynucleobacter sp.]